MGGCPTRWASLLLDNPLDAWLDRTMSTAELPDPGAKGPYVRAAVYLGLLALSMGTFAFSTHSDARGLAQNVTAGLLFVAIDAVARNASTASLYFQAAIKHRNTPVRVSISYLFRIKVDEKYLLVRNRHFGLFQPIGGVYKRYAGSLSTLSRLGVQDDRKMPIDHTSRDDLRIHVPGRNLLRLLRWFDSQQDREVSAHREFYEELVEPGIVRREVFPYPRYRIIGRKRTDVQYSPYFQCMELRVADIVELEMSPNQQDELRSLAAQGHSDIMFATADEIERRGVTPPVQLKATIGEHTRWII